jgi:hypothetical protein
MKQYISIDGYLVLLFIVRVEVMRNVEDHKSPTVTTTNDETTPFPGATKSVTFIDFHSTFRHKSDHLFVVSAISPIKRS